MGEIWAFNVISKEKWPPYGTPFLAKLTGIIVMFCP